MKNMVDLISWVKADSNFSDAYKKKVLGSLNGMTKRPEYAGTPLDQILVDLNAFDTLWGRGAVRHIPAGFKSKQSFSTWRSQVRSAMIAFLELRACAKPTPPTDAWSELATELLAAKVERHKLIALKVLADLARADGLAPDTISRPWLQKQIDEAATPGRYRAIRSTMALVARNRDSLSLPLAKVFSEAPICKSRLQCMRAPMPETLSAVVDAWCRKRLEGEPRGHRRKRRSSCSPTRVEQAVRGVSYVWTALLTAELVSPDAPVQVTDLAAPELLEEVIERELSGEFPWQALQPTTLFEYVSNWKLFLRGCELDVEPLTQLIRDFREFENVKSMSPARLRWCETFLGSPERQRVFLDLPNTLFHAAQKQMKSYETGSQYQRDSAIAISVAACAAAIWTSLPLRISTLLQLSHGGQQADVQLPDKKHSVVITTPAAIVKNGYSHRYIHLTPKRGGDPRAILSWFTSEVRPKLLEHHISPASRAPELLFCGISYARLNTIWQNATLEAGVPMTPHQVRHALATLLANQPGADYAIIAALLGDTEATVRKNYVFVDQARKHQEGQKLLAQLQANVLRRGVA